MLKDIWRVLTGKLSWKSYMYWFEVAQDFRADAAKAAQLKRDLGLAEAAITELRSQLPMDYEAQRKAVSDALAEQVLNDMKLNPKKFVP